MKALSWVLCAQIEFWAIDLVEALAITPECQGPDEANQPQIEDVLSACAGLITIGAAGLVRFSHSSTKEYLTERKINGFQIWIVRSSSCVLHV